MTVQLDHDYAAVRLRLVSAVVLAISEAADAIGGSDERDRDLKIGFALADAVDAASRILPSVRGFLKMDMDDPE